MKTCNVCNEEKSLDEFYVSRGIHETQCKKCRSKKMCAARKAKYKIPDRKYLNPDAEGKICTRCNVYKLREEYKTCTSSSDGMQPKCKVCAIERARELHLLKHPDAPSRPRLDPKAVDKYCWGCKQTKLKNEFYKNSKSKDGFMSRCIVCEKQESSARSKNPKSRSRMNAAWHKRMAVQKDQLGFVTKNPIVSLIEVYGAKCMNINCSKPIDDSNKLTLDHVIPISWGTEETKLHDMNNLQILCGSCNSTKSNRSDHDFRPFLYDWAALKPPVL